MKIYAEVPVQAAEIAELKRVTGEDEFWIADPATRTEADRHAFLHAEVVFGTFPADLLEAATCLRWIQFLSVGIESHRSIDWSKLERRVMCTNLRGVYADPMAQTALAGILALHRGIDKLVGFQARCDWQKAHLHPRVRVLHGAHVLLLGAGSVNRRLRELLLPFGCTFAAFARSSGDIHTLAALDAVLPHADLVCAALPDTPATRGLLDAARIARMKADAIFVNVGRGSLVDEIALVAALRAGKLYGAVLDVTQHEPLSPDDPLWACPRTILTQHTAAGSPRLVLDAIAFFGTNLERYRAGKHLLNLINWSIGY